MSNVKQVKAGKLTINIGQASAQDQLELYYLVYPFAERLYNEVDDVPKLGVNELAKVLAFTGFEMMSKIANLALSRAFVHGTDTGLPVDATDFDGDIDAYHRLVCMAVEVNLASFFTRLSGERADRMKALKAQMKALEKAAEKTKG
jgi:hypothetical protein